MCRGGIRDEDAALKLHTGHFPNEHSWLQEGFAGLYCGLVC